uniref:G-protein coupled receptors family 1 profile domain-containing protein n=1 Tax=Pelusios castaneus TaxID=367368 RepID=A0A8C8S7D3_9SAUR
MMSAVNDTQFHPAVFILTGIPGLEDVQVWISIPYCLTHFSSVVMNSVILFIIKTEPSLHEPMYIFLSMLAVTDLGLSISSIPTTLAVFWLNSREISHDACFAQLFITHSLIFTQSSVLLCMAFDRFVAICIPLRYTSILTPPRVAKMGLVSLLRGMVLTFPLPILLKQHRYCKTNVLSHSYCLHAEVMKLACSDIRVNSIYGFFLTVSSLGLDSLLILLSYVTILKAVLSIASYKERLKPLDTCVSHVCIVLLYYMPAISLIVIHRFEEGSSPLVQDVVGKVYFLILPLMNPIVYCVKTKSIRERIIRMFIK